MSTDVITMNIKKSENIIFDIIPELKNEKDFDQKNKYHCYDVWNHTIVALTNSKNDLQMRLALLLHDIGKPFSYQEENGIRHFKGHAQKSIEISKEILKRLDYSENEINDICFLIENHATPIDIKNITEDNIEKYKKILHIQYCDARAYNPKYSKAILEDLDTIYGELARKNNMIQTMIRER